jgi:hypothetical protein
MGSRKQGRALSEKDEELDQKKAEARREIKLTEVESGIEEKNSSSVQCRQGRGRINELVSVIFLHCRGKERGEGRRTKIFCLVCCLDCETNGGKP